MARWVRVCGTVQAKIEVSLAGAHALQQEFHYLAIAQLDEGGAVRLDVPSGLA